MNCLQRVWNKEAHRTKAVLWVRTPGVLLQKGVSRMESDHELV
jgi:hypothetical protein